MIPASTHPTSERNPGTFGARIIAACTLAIVLAAPALAADSRLVRDSRVLALHRARALSCAVARAVRGIVEHEESRAEVRPAPRWVRPAAPTPAAPRSSAGHARLLPVQMLDLPPPAC